MAKVKKINNVLVVGIPPAIAEALSIKEGDELEFFKHSNNSILVAKKDELLKLLEGTQKPAAPMVQMPAATKGELGEGEIAVLKKLDTLRYAERTKDKVNAILSAAEKIVLDGLVEKAVVTLYRKIPSEPFKYSIPKPIYDKFLYRKNQQGKPIQKEPAPPARIIESQEKKGISPSAVKKWEEKTGSSAYILELENKGYLVLKNEVDAASASASLEENIRQGLVVGTRAFDKKFYIGLKGFINKNAPQIMKAIGDKSTKAEDIAKFTGLEEDAVKTVLYLLAENGEVTEVRRGIFKIA